MEWVIHKVEANDDGTPSIAHWRVLAFDGENTVSVYGTQSVSEISSGIDATTITTEQAINLVKQSMGDDADRIEASAQSRLDEYQKKKYGVAGVVVQPTPSFDPATEKVEVDAVPVDLNGVPTIRKTVVLKTQEELDAELESWRATAFVSMASCRRVLLAAGLLDTVTTAMANASPEAQIQWEYEVNVRRTDPLVVSMQAALSLTDTQVDDLFKQGMAL